MSQEQPGIFCPNCGTSLPANARFCASCGTTIGAAPSPAAAAVPSVEDTQSKRKWLIPGIIGAAVAIAAVAAFAVLRGPGGSSDEILLGMLDRDGNFDVHVLNVGDEPTRDNRALEEVSGLDTIYIADEMRQLSGYTNAQAIRVDDKWIVEYTIEDDDKGYVASVTADSVTELLDSDAEWWSTSWIAETGHLHFTESESDSQRCLVSDGAEAADRVARAASCSWTAGGDVYTVTRSDDSVEIEVERSDGTVESVERDDYAGSYVLSGDGQYVAIALQARSDEVYVEYIRLATDEVILESDGFRGTSYSTRREYDGPRVATVMNDDSGGNVMLYFDPNAADVVEFDDGYDLIFTPDGSAGFVALRDDDQYTLANLDTTTYALDELLDGDTTFNWAMTPEGSLLSITPDGDASLIEQSSEVHDLGRIKGSEFVEGYYAQPIGESMLLVQTLGYDDDDWTNTLFTLDTSRAVRTDLLTGWTRVWGLRFDEAGAYAVFYGGEDSDDDVTLWTIRLDGSADVVELDDDADGYSGLSIRGDFVYYTADVGDDQDEYEVRRVSLTSGEKPEVLYTEARLLATAWQQPDQYLRGYGSRE